MCNICYQWFTTPKELTGHLKNINVETLYWCSKCEHFWEPGKQCSHPVKLKSIYCSICKMDLSDLKLDHHKCFHKNGKATKESYNKANEYGNHTKKLSTYCCDNHLENTVQREETRPYERNENSQTIKKMKRKNKQWIRLTPASVYIKVKYKFTKAREKYLDQVKKIKEGYYEENIWEESSSDLSEGETDFRNSKELIMKISDEETTLCWHCLQEVPALLLPKHESKSCPSLKNQTSNESSAPKKRTKIHEDERALCYICGQMPRRKYFRNHRRTHIPNYNCVMCDICGVTTTSISQHMLSHQDERKHICMECGKAFKRKKTLSTHRLVHTSIGKHVCPTCGKDFKVSYNLRVHMRTHMSKKPFECNLCNKTFTTKQWRDNHIKTHK